MKLATWLVLIIAAAQPGWTQTRLNDTGYTVQGTTPKREAVLRRQIEVMQPPVLPYRIRFVPVRVGPASSLVDTYWVQSTNFGLSFSAPTKVSSATSNWCTAVSDVFPNFGDYISGFATGNHVCAVWGDGRNGVPDTFDAVILGAGKSSH